MTRDDATTTEPDVREAETPAGPFTYHVAMRRALDMHNAAMAAPYVSAAAPSEADGPVRRS